MGRRRGGSSRQSATRAAGHNLVPLSPAAVAIFKARLALAEGPLVFPSAVLEMPMTWSSDYIERLREKMGKKIPRWTLHGLRHTAATHLTEDLGVPEVVVSLLLGHAPPGVPAISSIYNRAVRLAERRAALEAWASYLAEIAPARATSAAEAPSRDARGTRRAG